MSKRAPSKEQRADAASRADDEEADPYRPAAEREGRRRPSRRTWTVLVSIALVLVFGIAGALVRVPYVALGPGPTYDTLGVAEGHQVVQINGKDGAPPPPRQPGGELRMTTVSLNDDVSMFGALTLWASGRYALAPRELYYPPGQTDQQVKQQNAQEFQASQSSAETAALEYLGYAKVPVIKSAVVGGPAAAAGIPAGSRIVSIDGKPVATVQSVREAVQATKPNQRVNLGYEPPGIQPAVRSAPVVVAQSPEQGGAGYLGVSLEDRPKPPFEVKFSLEHIGGPSAGLMFSLAIVDRIRGDVPGSEHVAGTGEIDPQGNVGPIGGINFKLTAAREAGATTFLVPGKNCPEAAASAPEGLRLVKVDTLRGAVDELDGLRQGRPAPTCN